MLLPAAILATALTACPQPPVPEQPVQTRALTSPRDIMLHGIVAGTTFNANQSLTLNNASVFANAGLVLNSRNLTLNGNQISSTNAATCTDKSGQGLCVGGKPKFVSALVSVPKPDFTALKTKYNATPSTTIQNSLNLNSSSEISAKFDNQIVLVKGNLHLHAIATIKNAVIIVTESFKSNKDLTLENTRIIANEAQFNHTTTLSNSRILSDEDLSFNGKLESIGLSSVITNRSFTSNGSGISSSNGELAVIANQNLTLNQASSGKMMLWAGGNITVNQNLNLEGAMVAGGKVVLNSSVSVKKVSSHLNPDVLGGGQLPYGIREEGILRDGGTWTSSFGVSITAPVGSLRKPEIKVFVEIVDPTKLEKPLPDEVELADQGVYRIGAVGGASTKPTSVINLFQIRLPLQNPNPNRDLSVLTLIPGYYTSFHNDSPELEWNGDGLGNIQDNTSITTETSVLIEKGFLFTIVKSKTQSKTTSLNSSNSKISVKDVSEFSVDCAQDNQYKPLNCDSSQFSIVLSSFQTEFENITRIMNMNSTLIGKKTVLLARSGRGGCATSTSGAVQAFYDPKLLQVYICVDSSGKLVANSEKVQKTIRHELFHGFQFVYIDKLIVDNPPEFRKIKWIIESTADASVESNEDKMQVSTHKYVLELIRQVTQRFVLIPLKDTPNDVWVYQTQDFWVYAGLYKNFGLPALKPLFESQLLDPMNDLDKFFNDKNFDDNSNTGMRAAYWLWAKNQAYEKTQNFRQQGKPCAPIIGAMNPDFTNNVATYSLATTPKLEWTVLANALPEQGVAPLETRVLKIGLTGLSDPKNLKLLSLKVTKPDGKPLDKQKIRYKWYSDPNPKGKATCGVGEDTEVDNKNKIKYRPEKFTRNLYVLISNVSIDKATSADRINLEDVKVTIEPLMPTIEVTPSLEFTVKEDVKSTMDNITVTNTGDVDSTLEYQVYAPETMPDSNPNATNMVNGFPKAIGTANFGTILKPDQTKGSITKENAVDTFKHEIPVQVKCSDDVKGNNTIYISSKTGEIQEDGTPVFVTTPVSVTVDCAYKDEDDKAYSRGEPWLSTFDKEFLGFHGVGEFILTKSTMDDFEVQTRYVPGRESSFGQTLEEVSFNGAVAVKVGSDRVGVYASKGRNSCWTDNTCDPNYPTRPQVRVNGQVIMPPSGSSFQYQQLLPDGGEVSWSGDEITITSASRSETIRVRLFADAVGSVEVQVSPERRGNLVGLLGDNNNDKSDDYRLRNGSLLASPLTRDQLYLEWGESWRVDQYESLFDYEDNQSAYSFVDRSFPTRAVSLEGLTASARAAGEAACQAAGVVDTNAFNSCVIDVALTGNPGWADIAKGLDPGSKHIRVSPLRTTMVAGEKVQLSVDLAGVSAVQNVIWTTNGGSIVGSGALVEFVAPSQAGSYLVSVRSAQDSSLQATIPVEVIEQVQPMLDRFAVGSDNAALLNSTGLVSVWGRDLLNNQNLCSDRGNTLIDGVSQVRSVSTPFYGGFIVANTINGNLVTWGQLAHAVPEFSNTVKPPMVLSSANHWVGVTASNNSLVSLKRDGTAWYWLPVLVAPYSGLLKPFMITGVSNIVGLSPRALLKADGTVWQLEGEYNFTDYVARATQVAGLNQVIQVSSSDAVGNYHYLAVKADGTVWAWGANNAGQLGLGLTSGDMSAPQQILNLSNVVKVFAGQYKSYALKADGTLWVWGSNDGLIDGASSILTLPTQVPDLNQVKDFRASVYGTYVVKQDNTIFGWGTNNYQIIRCSSEPEDQNVLFPTLIPGVTW